MLDELEKAALDQQAPLADALRRCLVLAGRVDFAELLDWSSEELKGYKVPDALPEYRVVSAQVCLDGFTSSHQITGQVISPDELPDFTHGQIKEEFELWGGVGEIEAMLNEATDGVVRLGLPMGSDLVRFTNSQSTNRYNKVTALYWKVSTVALLSALDQIRTNLVSLVAELRYALPADGTDPGAAAQQAVNVVFHGANRTKVTVNTAQSGRNGTSTVTLGEADGGWWTKSRRVGAFVVGAVAVLAGLATIAAWEGWKPF